jgi:hypothetical protein
LLCSLWGKNWIFIHNADYFQSWSVNICFFIDMHIFRVYCESYIFK